MFAAGLSFHTYASNPSSRSLQRLLPGLLNREPLEIFDRLYFQRRLESHNKRLPKYYVSLFRRRHQQRDRRGHGAQARRTLPLDYHLSPPSLIGVSAQALTVGVPAVELRDVYSRSEVAMFGVRQGTEVRVPVLNFLF